MGKIKIKAIADAKRRKSPRKIPGERRVPAAVETDEYYYP